jgi:H+-transporting ATPase
MVEKAAEHATEQRAGLNSEEAHKRLAQFGPNALPEKAVNPLFRFLSFFWGPIPWMIEVAAGLSAFIHHWEDFAIIAVLLFMNAGVGFWEEFQAGNAVAALKKTLALKARVKRDGSWTTIEAQNLVPGDLVHLRIGDIVPADAKLEEGDPIEVDQSALTGESLPVERKANDTVYSSSIVKQGEIDAEITATGARTYFGKTAKLVENAHTVSHFQRAVMKIGDFLIFVDIGLVILILLAALFRGDQMLTTLQFAMVMTIAAVPVAMPAVLSVTMAVGSRNLARRKAIVTRLSSMEEMAGIDVLCSDKTGTLTQNSLTLGDPYCAAGVTKDDIISTAALASSSTDPDPIDSAVLSGAKSLGTNGAKVLHFEPFDPVHKRTEATIAKNGGTYNVTKGAPQVITALCKDVDEEKTTAAIDAFAARGFRSLGVAQTEGDGAWHFLGILPLFDPPREDSKATLASAREMGIKVKMLTGDQLAIAKETARQLGLGTNILDATSLVDAKMHQTPQLDESIDKADGFAQVFPEHKFFIVDVLQRRKHIVGMTGDGVNDAPALKKADAGTAVSGATDAARAAAAIVLMTPGLSVIIDAIKESRKIFQHMNSYAMYRIAETIRVLLFMTSSILIFNFYPVTAIMIVLLAILNDGAILSIAYDRVRYSMRPEAWDMRRVLTISTVLGLAGVIATFGLFYLAERQFHLARPFVQTLMYLKLSAAGQLTIFLTRTRGRFWSQRPAWILLGAVTIAQTIATLVCVYGVFVTPIGWKWALFVWGYAIAWFIVNDQIKLITYHTLDDGIFGARLMRRAAQEAASA